MLRNSGLTAHQLVTPRHAYSLQSPAALMQHRGSSMLYEASINFCTRRTSEVEKGTTKNRCANCFNLASLFPANELHGSTAASSWSRRVSETRGAACNLPLSLPKHSNNCHGSDPLHSVTNLPASKCYSHGSLTH